MCIRNYIQTLNPQDKVYIEKTLQMIQEALNTEGEIPKERLEKYKELLFEVYQHITHHLDDLLFPKEIQEKIKEELLQYAHVLHAKLAAIKQKELIENQAFRTKNLRGAKVEDLYFAIRELMQKNEEDERKGFVDGQTLLAFIEENFDYEPQYKQPLMKDGVLIPEGHVLYSKKYETPEAYITALDELYLKTKKIFIIAKKQSELYNKDKVILFQWIKKHLGGMHRVEGYEFFFTYEGQEEKWDSLRF